jgi:hypothetical protein
MIGPASIDAKCHDNVITNNGVNFVGSDTSD